MSGRADAAARPASSGDTVEGATAGREASVALVDLPDDNAWFHDPVVGVLEADRVAGYLGTLVGTHFDRLEVQLLDSVTQGDRAAIEWRQTTWSGRRRHELEGTSFVTQRDGRLVRMRDYFQFPPTTTSRTSAIT